jgi:FAD-dependent oxidoreductase domain-containing protein 1
MAETFDLVIAGGAVMGSSIAFHAAAFGAPAVRVLVIEPDPTYQRSASALSAGSIRQQFSSAVNIDISLYGIRFLREIGDRLAVGDERPDVGLKEGGYLYIASEAGARTLREINALQNARGADIALFDHAGMKRQFPWLQADDLAAGTWGRSGEGWFDGYGLMMAFRKKARSLGVEYRQDRVSGVSMDGSSVTEVRLASGDRIACGAFVNAAGASGARQLSEALGFPAPIYAKKRCVFSFSCKEKMEPFPLLIDTSGVWVRPEGQDSIKGQDFITGFSPDDLDRSDHVDDFEVDWSLFEAAIWPALASRVPAFEAIRPGRAWAGHYDMCLLDHNAMVGPVPGTRNAFMAAGFSGHGLQQSPAVGRGITELIASGAFQTIDLSPLSPERLLRNAPLLEKNVI